MGDNTRTHILMHRSHWIAKRQRKEVLVITDSTEHSHTELEIVQAKRTMKEAMERE